MKETTGPPAGDDPCAPRPGGLAGARAEYRVARERMVRDQLEAAGIQDGAVLRAMRELPRHLFVPRLLRHRAYQPCALPIGCGQTISKPATVGLMTALLELGGDERVLEIGTGSGYQAAVLSRLAASVVSVERIGPLAARAATLLAELGCANVEVLAADGRDGLAERGPFDALIVTACAPELPERLLWQLADGGRLLVPVAEHGRQVIYRCRRRGDQALIERSVTCRFVPLLPGVVTAAREGGA